ncbi:nitrate- and nitrite sensing domain-containing protein [Streptomyces sp. NA04227]|nr:nitrate- and nitrite sensing domain-containing protein [Streptomyces sp. NA04227]
MPRLRPSKGPRQGVRSVRISRRLILLVAVPLVIAIAFAGRALTPSTGQAVQAVRLKTAIEAAEAASELTYRLQRERAEGAAQITSGGDFGERFGELARATDESVARYREKRAELSSMPTGTNAALDRIDQSLGGLATLRAQVRSGSSAFSSTVFGYRIVIADLISFRDSLAQADGVNADVADHIRAAAALTEGTEHVAQQEVTVVRALAAGGFTPASLRTFEATRLGVANAYHDVATLGPEDWRTWMERTLSGPKAMAAEKLADQVGRSTSGQRLNVSRADWTKAMADRQALLRSVVERVDSDVLDEVSDERTRLIWWAVSELVLVLLMLVGVVLVATRLGRDLIRRLRDLRNAAHEVAHKRLPEEVRKLSAPGAAGRATPDQIAERAGRPLTDLADDEMGEVGQAFNSVHYAAVRLAAQQARSHDRFAETLVTVARRGARLNSVLTAELSTVQRDELDPKRMEALFALDHLAIRMERNAKNLLVLGGYGGGKVRSADAPCTSVIYAAAQQIEHYGRVSLGHIEPSITIAARVVDDIAHLLAELLDNATRFSPPETEVGVAAWSLWDRAVLQIVDEGVGMSADRRAELNAELAAPQSDIGAVRTMGLQVVGRLAARLGLLVELRESSGPGTIVEVILPKEVLAEPGTGTEVPPPPPAGGRERAAEQHHAAAEDGATGPEADGPRSHDEESPVESTVVLPAIRRSAPSPAGDVLRIDDEPQGGEGDHSRAAARRTGAEVPAPRAGATVLPPHRQEPTAAPAASAPDTATSANSRQTPGTSPDPVRSRIAGVSAAGLPMRRRSTPAEAKKPVSVPPRAGAADVADKPGTQPPKKAPRRRDSRQVSDVFAAYAQGINRSSRRDSGQERATGTESAGSSDDNTQRSTR